jgi:hypothetical protein
MWYHIYHQVLLKCTAQLSLITWNHAGTSYWRVDRHHVRSFGCNWWWKYFNWSKHLFCFLFSQFIFFMCYFKNSYILRNMPFFAISFNARNITGFHVFGIIATRGHISLWGGKQLPSSWIADHDFRSFLSCILLRGTVCVLLIFLWIIWIKWLIYVCHNFSSELWG